MTTTDAAVPVVPVVPVVGAAGDRTLPDGFAVRLRPDVRRPGPGVLVGGSPMTAMRLSARAQRIVADAVVRDADSARVLRRLVDANLADPDLDEVRVPAADLTVVVPTRDRADQLEHALASLQRGREADPVGVVVVDDDSRHPAAVADVVRRHGARLVRLPANVGPAGARNAGLRTVTTPYVAFVDSDIAVGADALLRLARHFADPAVGLVGPLVTARSQSVSPRWFERYDAHASSLSLGLVGGVVRPGAQVAWLPSACLVARTDRLGAGFDPALRVGEDVDLVWRLHEAGHTIRYDPTVRAEHDTRTSPGAWLGRKFVYGTGSAHLAVRHGDRVAPAAMAVPTALGALALLHRRRWSVPVAALSTALTAHRLRRTLPDVPGRDPLAARLAVESLGWGLRQEAGLVLRHWWPLTAALVPTSSTARRLLVSALAVDLLVDLVVDPRAEGRLPAAGSAATARPGIGWRWLGRRLDDLAYGGGLAAGSLQLRSTRALRIRRLGAGRRPRH